MVDELAEVRDQIQKVRDRERELLARVRGLNVHEYLEPDQEAYEDKLWLTTSCG